MHYLFYVTKYIPVIYTLASHLWHQQGNWGQSGVDVSKPAGYAVCDGSICLVLYTVAVGDCVLYLYDFLHIRCKRMCPVSLAFFFLSLSCRRSRRILFLTRFFLLSSSFFFFLLSSGNTRFSHISLHPILTKLGHNDRYLDHYSGTKDGGVRGHHGVTGVKKVICTKKASSPSDYVALTRDLCICSSLTPSTKVMVLKNCQGSFGVTGVKSSFSQNRHQVLQIM